MNLFNPIIRLLDLLIINLDVEGIVPLSHSAAINVIRKEHRRLFASYEVRACQWENFVYGDLSNLRPKYELVEVGVESGVVEGSNWKHVHHALGFRTIPQLQNFNLVWSTY
jgi:hypothetical protein